MTWRRFDTLFVRLFLLMWGALVLSHFVAFSLATPGGPAGAPPRPPAMQGPPGSPPGPPPGRAPQMPVMPSLAPNDLPRGALWIDYGVRLLVIALAAALGARWLSAPVRKLADASAELAQRLPDAKALPALDEGAGTQEVRQAARVFNAMARRLQQQFDARSLHMAAVSHDLRTPLTRMRIRLENSSDPTARASIADIREMDELVASSLAVLREQRDDMPAGVVDLAALLQAMADDLAESGQVVEIGELPPLRVRAHPASLRRIVGNLVGNALHHGGSARIEVHQRGDRAVATIDDAGPGIPADQLRRVFEPWVRLRGDATQVGHGLGLAIARDLAERDGGSVLLANRPDGGLRAEVTLPLA